MSVIENHPIVCISSIDWDPIWTRKQQIMSRLPVSNKILYVEPPVTLISPLKDKEAWKKWGMWFKGIRRLNDNIFLYSPPVTLPFGNKYRMINKINQWWISLFLKRVIAKLDLKTPMVWTYMPNSIDIIDRLGDREFLIYDCVDEHSEYTGFINKETVHGMENELMARCDMVFVTAQGLYDAKKDAAKTIYFLPNAANVQLFMKAQDPETKIPDDITAIKKPLVGFVGVIQDWIDLELVRKCAETYPEYSFALIGPVGAGINVAPLEALPNVTFLGRKNVTDLPSYIKAFDVCINPFKLNELTDKVSPLKFYEYLASGKPIVSVNMPGVSDFSDVVEIADNYEEFVSAIKRAIETETPEKLQKRLSRAMENSWDSRVEFMSEKIIEKMKNENNKQTAYI